MPASSLHAPVRALASGALAFAIAAAAASPAAAAPRWTIEKPVLKGRHSPFAAAPLQKQAARELNAAAHDEALAARYPIPIERIDVEGVRERTAKPAPPLTAEQRFAARLNEGSPELIAGRSYDGYYYDGTLFWGSDPLSFAWKNLTHWLSR